ncbi:MAG: ribonuclease P protein component [Spirulina sp. SIO3F2]|nr:ribonuclease P protein component [Spirulina sp. SIO3F2]
MGLPKPYRLKHWRHFQQVYERGRRYTGRYLVLRCFWVANATPCPIQIGIAVGKRISKKAVVRNRLKRQIRAALHPLLPELATNVQIVIGVKPGILECECEHFLRELKQLLTKAEVWNGH